ncbi:endoglucanase Y [Ectothiorhodospira sp. PHS-1]|uniref:glycosyl hydrolase family 8 n=1 Tax=Ectothiorhodospira sp. PHS-1 TaxID=519989 RepID=UPI00024A8693|nr:glycosyl hydrolase family 8 [Ectothiorhodospira sp. PHS-1]EHQ51189.1 endoglucanase Y [Ectothiorhodospira sp. PHS-1]
MSARLQFFVPVLAALFMIAGCDPRVETPQPAVEHVSAGAPFERLWHHYKARFVRDGRVLDVDNGSISHSEGQGYGMLLAVAADDRETFDALMAWTFDHLLRADGLLAWRFGECPAEAERARIAKAMERAPVVEGGECVNDPNNASDGEILVAWALLRAAKRWNEPAYLALADALARATVTHSLVDWHGRTILLPGVDGFVHGEDGDTPARLVVNLSYWVFPALDMLAEHFPEQPWAALAADGQALMREARFGTHALPPDWLALGLESGALLGPAADFDPVYGFNAVRIPLHLVWGRVRWQSDDLAPFMAWWNAREDGRFSAWVDLETGTEADYDASAGVRAIALVTRALDDGVSVDADQWPDFSDDDGYFSWSLGLLARVAAQDASR